MYEKIITENPSRSMLTIEMKHNKGLNFDSSSSYLSCFVNFSNEALTLEEKCLYSSCLRHQHKYIVFRMKRLIGRHFKPISEISYSNFNLLLHIFILSHNICIII